MTPNKKNLTIGVLGAALLATSGLAAVDAAGQAEGMRQQKGQHTEIREMVENRDYAAWAEQNNLPPGLADFTEAEFNQFADMMELKQAGEDDAAEQIREELGLPEQPERGNKQHRPRNGEMHQYIVEGDFEAWAGEAQEHGIDASLLTQENFDKIKAAVESGDREAVRTVHEEIGLKPMHNGNGERAQKILELTYDEWATQAAKRGIDASHITQATYATLQESATLFQNGDVDSAKALLDEAGITPPRDARGNRGMREKGPRGLR